MSAPDMAARALKNRVACSPWPPTDAAWPEVADQIEVVLSALTQAQARIAELEGVLKPFARLGDAISSPDSPDTKKGRMAKDETIFVGQVIRGKDGAPDRHHPVTFGDLRRARAALTPNPTESAT